MLLSKVWGECKGVCISREIDVVCKFIQFPWRGIEWDGCGGHLLTFCREVE